MVFAYAISRLGEDNIDKAASRLASAFVTKDTRAIYDYVKKDERLALELNESSFEKLLQSTLYKNYKLDPSVDVKITKFGSMRQITIQDLDDPSGRSLPVVVVGTPGNFRVEGFVEFCLQASSIKENYDPKLVAGELKQTALKNYLLAHTAELESIGIHASYDPNRGTVTAFGPRIEKINQRLALIQSNRNQRSN